MKEQLIWEQECLERGQQRYFDVQDKLRDKGNSLTQATSFVLKDRLVQAAQLLEADCNSGISGQGGSYNKLVRQIAGDERDYLKVAYIGLKYLLTYTARGQKLKVANFVSTLGSALETELKCQMFEASYPAYFHTVLRSFNEQGVTSGSHMQKAMMKKFGDFDIEWTNWTIKHKVHVGTRVFRNILKAMDDLFFLQKKYMVGRTDFYIDTTVAFDDWVAEFEKERGLLLPLHLPLKCPPKDWVKNGKGAYYTPRMEIPFIKAKKGDARRFVEEHTPKQHMKAVSKLQRTAWRINNRVLKVQEEIFQRNLGVGIPSSQPLKATPFPEHLTEVPREELTHPQKEEVNAWKMLRKSEHVKEMERKGQVIGFRQSHLLAQELRDWEKFYFAYNCDFRGRIYCATAGLSPQGADGAKGLLQFATGVKLGDSGLKWLAIHGANTFGEDKLTYDDRVTWIKSNEDLIRGIVEDPISNTQWSEADKPYQFLAFCYEWADSNYGRNKDAVGYIPVGLDGSCNGLQHFSAMLRDEVGAKATNLLDSELPEDIYGEVADVVMKKLEVLADTQAYAKIWLQVGVDRKCTKRPVMTLPYGSTRTSAKNYILEYVNDNWDKFNLDDKYKWDMANYLTPILWESIGEVVVAARLAMDWLQKNVGKQFCHWVTILGFPVYQHYRTENMHRVDTYLEGKVGLAIADHEKGVVYRAGQRNGVAPNFIHSIDSSHMVLTINASNFNAYAMIHDDFGTHAGNTEKLFHVIRKAFKHMYSNTDPLKHWAAQVGADSSQLRRGAYNIEDITDAKYFFG